MMLPRLPFTTKMVDPDGLTRIKSLVSGKRPSDIALTQPDRSLTGEGVAMGSSVHADTRCCWKLPHHLGGEGISRSRPVLPRGCLFGQTS